MSIDKHDITEGFCNFTAAFWVSLLKALQGLLLALSWLGLKGCWLLDFFAENVQTYRLRLEADGVYVRNRPPQGNLSKSSPCKGSQGLERKDLEEIPIVEIVKPSDAEAQPAEEEVDTTITTNDDTLLSTEKSATGVTEEARPMSTEETVVQDTLEVPEDPSTGDNPVVVEESSVGTPPEKCKDGSIPRSAIAENP